MRDKLSKMFFFHHAKHLKQIFIGLSIRKIFQMKTFTIKNNG